MKAVKTLTLLTVCVTSIALADDFKTMDGKEYKNATVTRVEPDGIAVKTKSGISKLYFQELPKEVQQRFNYDPQQATAYSAAQAAPYEAYQKHQEEVRRRQEDADAQNKAQNFETTLPQEEEPVQQAGQGPRPRPTSTPRRTTVLHQLPVVLPQSTPLKPPAPKPPAAKPPAPKPPPPKHQPKRH